MASDGGAVGARARSEDKPAAAEEVSTTFKVPSCVLRLRGLPFNCSQSDVESFFLPLVVSETVLCKRAGELTHMMFDCVVVCLSCAGAMGRRVGRGGARAARLGRDTRVLHDNCNTKLAYTRPRCKPSLQTRRNCRRFVPRQRVFVTANSAA
jgi:hypothetical protein